MSQCNVGLAFIQGNGVAVDYKNAKHWLEKSMAQSYPRAAATLGHMYLEGLGVTPSMVRAGALIRGAQKQGEVVGAQDLAQLASIENNVSNLGQGGGPKIGSRVVIGQSTMMNGVSMGGRCGVAIDFGAWCRSGLPCTHHSLTPPPSFPALNSRP